MKSSYYGSSISQILNQFRPVNWYELTNMKPQLNTTDVYCVGGDS